MPKTVKIYARKMAELIDSNPLITAAGIARIIGVARETVQRWKKDKDENGTGVIGVSVDGFNGLAAALKIDPMELYSRIGAKDYKKSPRGPVGDRERAIREIRKRMTEAGLKLEDLTTGGTLKRQAAKKTKKPE